MSLLESVILLDVMEVISSQDDSSRHFVGKYDTFEDSASDANTGGERTFLINVLASLGFLRGLETKTDLLEESSFFLLLGTSDLLGVLEDAELFLESSFSLDISHC